jgi:hypothetical protein
LNGTISAWDKQQTAFIQATTPGAVYTGLATFRRKKHAFEKSSQ